MPDAARKEIAAFEAKRRALYQDYVREVAKEQVKVLRDLERMQEEMADPKAARAIKGAIETLRKSAPVPDGGDGGAASLMVGEEPGVVFVQAQSIPTYPAGHQMGSFPVQETTDPVAPWKGQGVYFDHRNGGTDVVYQVRSPQPVRKLHWHGAAMQNMTIEILDEQGKPVAVSGPHSDGNVWGEYVVSFSPRKEFLVRSRNHATVWLYIHRLRVE